MKNSLRKPKPIKKSQLDVRVSVEMRAPLSAQTAALAMEMRLNGCVACPPGKERLTRADGDEVELWLQLDLMIQPVKTR